MNPESNYYVTEPPPIEHTGDYEMSKSIDEAVNKFLAWQLPHDFSPDNGVEFNPSHTWPTGTNLLTATQAKAMIEHMLGIVPTNDGHKLPPSDPRKLNEKGVSVFNKIGTSMLAYGVTRVADNPRAVMVLLRQNPSDDDLRALHEALRPVHDSSLIHAIRYPPPEQECDHRRISYCHGSSLWVCENCDERFNADEFSKLLLEPPEEGMTIKGDGASELGRLMREQRKGGPVPYA